MVDRFEVAGHAFISYVREDTSKVDRLQQWLEAAGIQVWRDTANLWPGQDWRAEIRRAITDDALVFLACFSGNSVSRGVTYQNEELVLAVEQLRTRGPDLPWLIPVRFDDCVIPHRDIGGGRTLASIQRADLFGDHLEASAERLVGAVRRILGQAAEKAASSRSARTDNGVAAAELESFAAERQRYLKRLLDRYSRLDLEVLTPLTEQGEHPRMLLDSVFVPQLLRENPPPLEFPREFWLRLARTGEVRPGDVPDTLDRLAIERIRKSYQDRPARPALDVAARFGGRRMVLLGDPGAGKSTLARYLMLMLADPHGNNDARPARTDRQAAVRTLADTLPLLVELRTFAGAQWRDRTFLDLIDHLHTTENLGLPKQALQAYLRGGGQALVVFDGLDEVFDPALRELVTRQIEAFAALYPQIRVVVTSRVIGYRRAILDSAGFSHWMLQDLDPEQVRVFTTTWYESSCPGNPVEAARLSSRLLGAVRDSPAVAELAGNPMLLTILAIIGRRQELPRERRTVYEHAVSVLIEHWDATGKHLRDPRIDGGMEYLSRDDKFELLRLIARRMQDGPGSLAGNQLPGHDLCAEFEDFLSRRFMLPITRAAAAARGMLDQLRERNFILARFGAGVYGFVHRAFLEYLAACDISARFAAHEISADDLAQIFVDRWQDPAWHEVLVLLAGLIPASFAATAIGRLLAENPASHLRPEDEPVHLFLAIRCLGEVRKAGEIVTQAQAISSELVALLETYEANRRDYPYGALDEAMTAAAVPVVKKFGPNWAGRQIYERWYLTRGQFGSATEFIPSLTYATAQIYFAMLGTNEKADQVLRQTIVSGPMPDVRRAAVEALAAGWNHDPAAQSLLCDRAVLEWHEDVRRTAVEALAGGWHDDPGTALLLRDRAVADRHEDVRRAAVEALASGWHDDPGTAHLLHDRAVADWDWFVRIAAVDALAVRSQDRLDLSLGPWLRDRATTDADEDVRETALLALVSGWRDDPGTALLLRDCATTDWHEKVRRAAVRALAVGWQDDSSTAPWLRDRISDSIHPDVRQSAIEALAAWWPDDPGTVSLLRDRAVTDRHRDVRLAAVEALAGGWYDDPGTPLLLRECAVADWDWFVRTAAVEALASGWHDDPGTATLLRDRAVADQHGSVRDAAVKCLAIGWHDDAATGRWLRSIATAAYPNVRVTALQALAAGWRNDAETAPLLRDRARADHHQSVRRIALDSLAARWHDEPTTAPLLRELAMTDYHEIVRDAAIGAIVLGWHDDPETVPLLRERATADLHEIVRDTAIDALAVFWHDDPAIAEYIRQRAVSDQHPDVRQTAIRAVAALWHDEPAIWQWVSDRAIADHHPHVRKAAIEILANGWHDKPEIARLLRDRATADYEQEVRREAVKALAETWHDEPGTRPWLVENATEGDYPDVRQAALEALARGWRNDLGTGALLRDRATTDYHEEVRLAAVECLAAGWSGDPEVAALLRERAISDWDEFVRAVAVEGLAKGWHHDPETAPLLRDRAINDLDEDVRQAALKALAEGWYDEATTSVLLDRAANDHDADVRKTAAEALSSRQPDRQQTAAPS